MMTSKEWKEFLDWSNKTNPTNNQKDNYLKEKQKNKSKQEEKNFNFSYGLDNNYQGLGNGNYTMEEYAGYEL